MTCNRPAFQPVPKANRAVTRYCWLASPNTSINSLPLECSAFIPHSSKTLSVPCAPICRVSEIISNPSKRCKDGFRVAATAEPAEPLKHATTESKQKLKAFIFIFATALVLWNMPPQLGVRIQAWRLFAIFIPTMLGIILQPLPSGAVALMALGVTVLTKTLSFQAAFSAFGGEVPWLVLSAMFLAQSFAKTGLGRRIAFTFVSLFGAHPLGLAYSLVFSEAILSPGIPSVAARSGGLILPLVVSMSEACGSKANNGTASRIGAYLIMTIFQTSAVSSCMFLTANHPNPLTAQFASDVTGMHISWTMWAVAAAVPGIVSLSLIPLVLWVLQKPSMRDSRPAQILAKTKLSEMGAMSRDEIVMAAACGSTITLWVLGGVLGVNSTAAAILGVSMLLVSGVLDWEECLGNKSAWNTFTWFATIVAFATQLKSLGFIAAVTSEIAGSVGALGLSWQWSCLLLTMSYFYSHYFFASNLSHVSAMCQAFLTIAIAAVLFWYPSSFLSTVLYNKTGLMTRCMIQGSPAMLAALVSMFISNFMGGISYWGMSHAPMYYGSGYVTGSEFLKLGFVISVFNLAAFLIVGSAWWRYLGLW